MGEACQGGFVAGQALHLETKLGMLWAGFPGPQKLPSSPFAVTFRFGNQTERPMGDQVRRVGTGNAQVETLSLSNLLLIAKGLAEQAVGLNMLRIVFEDVPTDQCRVLRVAIDQRNLGRLDEAGNSWQLSPPAPELPDSPIARKPRPETRFQAPA